MNIKLLAQLCREYEAGFQFKQGRVKDWQSTEDLYFGKMKKTLKNRSSIPIPIMSGFLNTLISKIDEPPVLKFTPREESDTRLSQKIQALYDTDRNRFDYSWDMADLGAKKMASFYGRGIFKTYGEKPYKFNIDAVDPYNFYVDPLGGGWLENARYCGETGIWRDRYQIEEGVKSKLYDAEGVQELFFSTNDSDDNVNDDGENSQKVNRFSALSLTTQSNFSGSQLYELVESGTTFEGDRWYVLWSYEKKCILRAEKLKDVFKCGLWWWTSFAPYHDENVFWTISPADDIRPVAQAMFVLINQELDNRQRTNWNMIAYDPDVFEGEQLDWRPDGRIMAKKGSVKPLSQGIFQFQTPQLNGTINLVDWMDNLLGQKTGVNSASQGQTEDTKVGIYYGNLQQAADRLGLISKYYQNTWKSIGRRYIWSLKENLPLKTAIKMIGSFGVEWDVLLRSEVNPDLDINVESSNAQMQADEVKKKSRVNALGQIQANPALANVMSPKWLLEQILLTGEFTSEEVRRAMDKDWGNDELLAEAAEAIDKIVKGKPVKPNRGANPAYLQKILDYAVNNTDEDFELFKKLMMFIDENVDFAIQNMTRKLPLPDMGEQTPPEMPPEAQNLPPEMPQEPIPNTMGGTMAQSQNLSNLTTPL